MGLLTDMLAEKCSLLAKAEQLALYMAHCLREYTLLRLIGTRYLQTHLGVDQPQMMTTHL
jgi:hypothetical protein